TEKAMKTLGQVEVSLQQEDPRALRAAGAVSSALLYNRAFLLARSPDNQRQRLAMGELENYLRHSGSALAWWQLAYQRYSGLCKYSGATPKTEAALLSQTEVRFRPVAALEIDRTQIALGESLMEAKKQLGAVSASNPLVRGTNLVLLEYPDRGIKLMGTDEVLAIVLSGDQAPALPIREMGLGAKSAELRVGMTSAELDQQLGESGYDFRQLVDPELNYRFYSDLGIAVLTKDGKVIELVIGQVPKRKVGI
ncbi:MAG TPA: hypothetical protein VNW97_07095, partial [Candidatus Saccharimonadales bacterium]|nr:hypothetical protein [Candidatus Saccharimonadales bacterium]